MGIRVHMHAHVFRYVHIICDFCLLESFPGRTQSNFTSLACLQEADFCLEQEIKVQRQRNALAGVNKKLMTLQFMKL